MRRRRNTPHFPLRELYIRDEGICHLCGGFVPWGVQATRDHILNWYEGGANARSNLALAHKSCNGKRGPMTVAEFKEMYALMLERHRETGRMMWPRDVVKARYREVTTMREPLKEA